jgi:hypothetical protein
VTHANLCAHASTKNQSPGNDYNCDLYEDQSYDENDRCYHEDYPLLDDDCSSQSSDDSLNQYYLIHNGRLEEPDHLPDNALPRSDAQNRFQVMLHDLIMRHKKASLQMFDDICHLVNEYFVPGILHSHKITISGIIPPLHGRISSYTLTPAHKL